MFPLLAVRRHLLVVLTGAALALLALTATASAESYGELTRFGEPSPTPEPGKLFGGGGFHVFGTDTTDGSVYIGDEPEPGKYRIQKLSATGTFLGSVSFNAPARSLGMEGVAVDHEKGRVYALVVFEREEDEEEEKILRFDPSAPAAGNLYAFSTEPEGQTLVPAKNEKNEPLPEGVLINREALGSPSEVSKEKIKQALLEPSGIAVDPATHEVVIVGQEDEATKTQDHNEEPKPRAAVQRVRFGSLGGELGGRFVDKRNCLLEGEPIVEPHCAEAHSEGPVSPVVTPSGRVYAELRGASTAQIWEIPTTETVKLKTGEFEMAPRRLVQLSPEESGQELVSFSEAKNHFGMAFFPEGERAGKQVGKVYVDASILQDKEEAGGKVSGGFVYPGVVVLNYAEEGEKTEASEEGWTGGPATSGKCAIEAPGGVDALVGAGKEQHVLMFAFRPHEEGNPEVANVIEFGQGGEGCPTASLSKAGEKGISATVGEKEISPVLPSEEVTLSSEIFQANALSATWKIENTATHAVEEYTGGAQEFQKTKVPPRKFAEGEYKITETVTTDDLASPEIKAERTLKVETPKIDVRFSSPTSVNAGEATTFNAEASHDPNGEAGKPLTYEWSFGDGSPPEKIEGKAIASHTYGKPGHYKVSLKITDHAGLKSATAEHEVEVVEKTGGSGGGGGGTGGGGEGGGTGGGSSGGTGGGGSGGGGEVHNPEATLAGGASLNVNGSGAVTLKVTCPAGESSCSGTVTLRTLGAVNARAARHKKSKKRKAAILTLASGSFSVAGGQVQAVTLHLSAKARALLARSHVLRVQVTLMAHDPAGVSHTTQTTITLHAARAKGRHKR